MGMIVAKMAAAAVETEREYRAFRAVWWLTSVVGLRLLLEAQTFPDASISFLILVDLGSKRVGPPETNGLHPNHLE